LLPQNFEQDRGTLNPQDVPPFLSYALVTSFLTIEKADAIWVWQGVLNMA
jgi:hypothetical protein